MTLELNKSDFLSYFDGLMLGDGSLNKDESCINYKYSQTCKTSCKEWLGFIKERFELDGIESKISLNTTPGKHFNKSFNKFINSNGSHQLKSHVYSFFTEQEKRWYKKDYNVDEYSTYYWHKDKNGEWYVRKKIVPKDICLTPECIANWYLGDGSCPKRTHSNEYRIILSTNGFWRKDTVFVLELLSEVLNIKCSVYEAGEIYIGIRSDISTFLNYMSDCEIPDCYYYKFPEGARI